MKIGIALGALNPAFHEAVVLESEALGFESVWLPEHLIFPATMSGSPHVGQDHPPVPPTTPVYDVFAMLSYYAARTERIRLGSNVYLLGLRHPFVAARAIQTFDLVSQGRAEIGIGAGWLREEWTAVGLAPETRGRRLDEALEVCRRLWTEDVIEHHGEFYDFAPVCFEPKPCQMPHPRIHVGGESDAALRRAAQAGDGWLGLQHDLTSVRQPVAKLMRLRAECGREGHPFQVTIGAQVSTRDELAAWSEAGVDRIITSPWQRSREAIEGMRALADVVL
jgi:probable F420-dependent oxidoreductase